MGEESGNEAPDMKNADLLDTGRKKAPGDLIYLQGLVNTIDIESGRDDLADPEAATAWLVRHGLIEEEASLTEESRRLLVDFREGIRSLLFANHGDRADPLQTARLGDILSRVSLQIRLSEEGRFELHPGTGGVEGAIARLSEVAHRAMLEATWPRLKACLNDTCQWAFYDSSRNKSGAWCSMEVCGNRMKVKHHRERAR